MTEFEGIAMRFLSAGLRLTPLVMIPSLTVLAWAPTLVRLAVLLVLAASLAMIAPFDPHLPSSNLLQWAIALSQEFLMGLLLAFAVALPAAALSFAGRLADTQSGFSAANIINPSIEREAESLIGTALALSATVLFFALDLHLQLLAVLVDMLALHPLGTAVWTGNADTLLHAVSTQFTLGLMVAAPVSLAMFAVDLGTAYATRSMPQANVYFLALPFKVFAALLVLATTAKHLPHLIGRMYSESVFSLPRLLN